MTKDTNSPANDAGGVVWEPRLPLLILLSGLRQGEITTLRWSKAGLRALTLQEMQALRATAAACGQGLLYDTLLQLGLRRSEVLALRLSDLDVWYATLTIRRPVRADGTLKQAKSLQSCRTIPLPDGLAERLIAHREQQMDKSEFIFTHAGAPIKPAQMARLHRQVCIRADLTCTTMHSLRYTALTRLAAVGISTSLMRELQGLRSHESWGHGVLSHKQLRRWLNETEQKFFSDTESLE